MSRKRKAGLRAICGRCLRKAEAGRAAELPAADLTAARPCADGSSAPVASGRCGVGGRGPPSQAPRGLSGLTASDGGRLPSTLSSAGVVLMAPSCRKVLIMGAQKES